MQRIVMPSARPFSPWDHCLSLIKIASSSANWTLTISGARTEPCGTSFVHSFDSTSVSSADLPLEIIVMIMLVITVSQAAVRSTNVTLAVLLAWKLFSKPCVRRVT